MSTCLQALFHHVVALCNGLEKKKKVIERRAWRVPPSISLCCGCGFVSPAMKCCLVTASDSDLRSRPVRLSRVRLYRVLTVGQMLLGVFAPLGVELVILLTHDHRQNYKQNHENADDLTDLTRTTRLLWRRYKEVVRRRRRRRRRRRAGIARLQNFADGALLAQCPDNQPSRLILNSAGGLTAA